MSFFVSKNNGKADAILCDMTNRKRVKKGVILPLFYPKKQQENSIKEVNSLVFHIQKTAEIYEKGGESPFTTCKRCSIIWI
jgi:hypothetical protein